MEQDFLSPSSDPSRPHTIYIGERKSDGHSTGEPAIVCVVADKLPVAQLAAKHWPVIPQELSINGEIVPIDVIQDPAPHYQICFPGFFAINTQNEWQRCHDCPLPGGVQIAPHQAQWVGTLGASFYFRANAGSYPTYGALTNYHVAHGGRFPIGHRILQPHGQSNPDHYFGKLAAFAPIDFRGGDNLVDAAVIDCRRTDGPYAPTTDTVRPEQLEIGRIVPTPETQPRVGMDVVKSGRTTHRTAGRIVGIESSTYVDYGPEGTAKFVRQLVIESASGNFSAGGDSGSLILTPDRRPIGLLFAGGGRATIANPIGYVLDAFLDSKFF